MTPYYYHYNNHTPDINDIKSVNYWAVQKTSYFGDQRNGIGDGEDGRGGGGCIYIAISDLTFEVMWCCRDLHTISHHSHIPHPYYIHIFYTLDCYQSQEI